MFGNRFDNELNSKIEDLLAKTKPAQTRIDEFLREDLHVDPNALPLTKKQALTKIRDIFGSRYDQYIAFEGNSLGFKNVSVYVINCFTCPSCATGDIETLDPLKITQMPPSLPFSCMDCSHTWEQAAEFQEDLSKSVKEERGNDLERIYNALIGDTDHYSFLITDDHTQGVVPIIPRIEPDIKWYGPGMTLRLARHIISESGNSTEYLYAKVGNLYSDTEVCILPSMKPIPNLPEWHVVEVL